MAVTNGIPLINGVAYVWADIVCLIGGIPVTGITAVEYGDSQDVVDNYGAGRYPVSRGKGRITCTAKLTLAMDEVVAISNRSINGRMQDIAPFDVIVSYLPDNGVIVHDTIKDAQFIANTRAWKEGDTDQQVELELRVAKIDWGKTVA